MRLKIIIGAGILILILFVSTYYSLVKSEGFYKSEVTVDECGDNYEKAAELLMKRYLSHYCSPLVGLRNFLTKYEVIKIDAYNNKNGSESLRDLKNCYGFDVSYNVRMFKENDWVAGNGRVEKNGWVNGKIGFGYFHKNGNRYILDSIGTGP